MDHALQASDAPGAGTASEPVPTHAEASTEAPWPGHRAPDLPSWRHFTRLEPEASCRRWSTTTSPSGAGPSGWSWPLAAAFSGAPLHTSLYDPARHLPRIRATSTSAPFPLDRIAASRGPTTGWPSRSSPRPSRVSRSTPRWPSAPRAAGPTAPGSPVARSSTATPRPAGSTSPTATSTARRRRRRPPVCRCWPRRCAGWDRRAAATADRYLVNSTAVRRRVADLYGIEAEVVPPPVDVDPAGPPEPVAGIEPGFFLCVSRLLPYKNVEAVTEAFRHLPGQRLVVVGTGPAGRASHAPPPRPT